MGALRGLCLLFATVLHANVVLFNGHHASGLHSTSACTLLHSAEFQFSTSLSLLVLPLQSLERLETIILQFRKGWIAAMFRNKYLWICMSFRRKVLQERYGWVGDLISTALWIWISFRRNVLQERPGWVGDLISSALSL